MPADNDSAPQTDGQTPGTTGEEHYDASGLAVCWWSALGLRPGVPWRMGAQLERLRAAFPGFSFGICQGWRGPAFEAWRDPHPDGGLYAVITRDAAELWRELEGCRDAMRPVIDVRGRKA